MAIFRFRNSKVWWYEFQFAGQRIRESTKTRSKKLAGEAQRTRRRELEEAFNGIKRRDKAKLLSVAAAEHLAVKKLTLSARGYDIEARGSKRVCAALGRNLVSDILPADIAHYQQSRLSAGAAGATINLEVGTLRAILRRNRVWANIQLDVRMLPVREDVGRAISEEEELALLQACLQSRSRSLYPAVVLALCTGMRYSEIRLLRWRQIDLAGNSVLVGKSKTDAGSGRTIPLNARAAGAVKMWAAQFPARQPEQAVFPSERYGAAGDAFTACAYACDPEEPIHSWKVAWQAAKRRAAKILRGDDSGTNTETVTPDKPTPTLPCRFHDLRHTACTRMLEGGTPYPVVAAIMGWSAAMAIRMAKRYGHIGQKAHRQAVDLLNGAESDLHPFEKSPESQDTPKEKVQ